MGLERFTPDEMLFPIKRSLPTDHLIPSGKLGYRHFNGRDCHYNVFLSLDKGPASFRREGYWARYHSCLPKLPSLNAMGFYGQTAYFLHSRLQTVAKFEYFDPNQALHNSQDLRWTTLGLNLYLVGNQLKLQANDIFKTERTSEIHNDTFILQLQFFFGYPHNPRLERWDFLDPSSHRGTG